MKRLLPILVSLIITTGACKKPHLTNEQYIIGNWVEVSEKKLNQDIDAETIEFEKAGFTFYEHHLFDNKSGYFKQEDKFEKFLGTRSKFKLIKDTLVMLNPENNKWEKHRIIKLSSDELELDIDSTIYTFKHYETIENRTPQFDQIVLSTSGCFGTCPIVNIVVNKNGSVIFNGVQFTNKQGLFKGNISTAQYQSLENNFTAGGFDSLKDSYKTDWTDMETVCTSFIKDGKIIKTVKDYGSMAPYWFAWGYVPLRDLYQTINLKTVPDSLSVFSAKDLSFNSSFKISDQVADLKQSESFLLFCYLQQGKTSNEKFAPRFKFHGYFEGQNLIDADTDGRYYRFNIKGKPVTIDIGFNFYDVNKKNWSLRKANKYD